MVWQYENNQKPAVHVTGSGLSVGHFNLPNLEKTPKELVGVAELKISERGLPTGTRIILEITAPYAEAGEKPQHLPKASIQFLDRYKDALKKKGIEVEYSAGTDELVQIVMSNTSMKNVATAIEAAKLAPEGFANSVAEREAVMNAHKKEKIDKGQINPSGAGAQEAEMKFSTMLRERGLRKPGGLQPGGG